MNEAELSANVTFTYIITNRWLGFRMGNGMLILQTFAIALCVGFKDIIETALLAFSLQVVTDFAMYFSISVRNLTEM